MEAKNPRINIQPIDTQLLRNNFQNTIVSKFPLIVKMF